MKKSVLIKSIIIFSILSIVTLANSNVLLADDDLTPVNCSSLLGDPGIEGTPAFYLVVVFKIIKYIAIILLVVLSMIEFIGATISQDKDAIMKAVKKTGLRLILCVVLFLLPTILEFILKYVSDKAMSLCGIN